MVENYTVLQDLKLFEVREYNSHVEVQTDSKLDYEGSLLSGYGLIMDYIEGNNSEHRAIEFVPPLYQKQKFGGRDQFLLSLPLPSAITPLSAPQPLHPALKVISMPRRRCAALKYTGRWSRANFQRHWVKLRAALIEKGWTNYSVPTLARYDSPIWPWFWRRNEIIVDLA